MSIDPLTFRLEQYARMARLLKLMPASVLALLFIAGGVARSQTCDTLLGKTECGGSGAAVMSADRKFSNTPAGATGLSTQALGRGLSFDDDQPGMFGALTFGGRGATCSGPFRVRSC